LNSALRSRLLSLGSYAFIGLSVFVLAISVFLYVNLGSVEKALPIRTVNQYRNLANMMPLLYELESDLDHAPANSSDESASKLRFTINKINTSKRLIDSVFEMNMPSDLSMLMSEISTLVSDISAVLASGSPITATGAILYENSASYIYSEFRDYVLRINNDTLLALEGQGAGLGRLKIAMLLALSIVFLAVLLTFVFLRRQRRLIAQLEESRALAMEYSEAKSQFLSKMTHEIRTPLNAILGYSQILLRESDLPTEARREIEIMNSSGEHLLGLINEILETAKIEAGKVEVFEEDCGLRDMLAQIEDMFAPATRKKGIDLALDIASDVPDWIKTDRSKLKQALINLVGNAVKFTDEGRIGVHVALPPVMPGKLAFEVSDTGKGIDAKDSSQIFKAFEQAEEGRDRGGTGLGLSISQQYARLLGGDLSVDSKVGEGSRFTLTIRLTPGQERAQALATGAKILGIASGRPPRTLIVDDRETNRDILVRILEPLGFPVAQASDGPKALGLVDSWKPELLLLDLILPGMSGRDIIRALRSDPSKKALRIIVITASALEDERKGVMDLGADAFIRKPFREREVLDDIGRAFSLTYAYDEEKKADESAALLGPPELKRRLAALPAGLRDRLGDALKVGDAGEVRAAADDIAVSDPGLAAHIRYLADDFEFSSLMATLMTLRSEVSR
jgi:signal transduction histidine kinase/FixJ family two-component response regulator